ncbi:ADP-dependent glucokinase/phosphofructokinase [Methanohalobium sp.]|uniref:ADP-dependent glucokinase/phosphofructokinase n=1 Tax=Methanohalobium sp. TaxID=2837493 RepID=UPI0025D1889C|nr:ADP-dependent glucokinase/phosphofructokinase [Methanohalobium sp.]
MNILCGYNANIDSVYRITGDEIYRLLEHQNQDNIIKKIENPPNRIDSIDDFIAGLIICIRNGSGAEWLVHDDSVFEFLKNHFFDNSIIRMGGNCGIMSNVLSLMGAGKVVPNVAKPSKTQLDAFTDNESIIIPGYNNQNDINEDKELIHFVFDFKKGEKVTLNGSTIAAPRENRFIATYDCLNIELTINPDFKHYADEHIHEMDGALISGYHMLQEYYPDGSSYVDKFQKSLDQIKIWKQLNKQLLLHVELGHFSNVEIAQYVFSSLADHVDGMGMNEDELAMLHRIHSIPVNDILQMNAISILKASLQCVLISGLEKFIIHTREFTLCVCKPEVFDAVCELESMKFGVKCAAVFADTGMLNNRNYVEKTASKLEESYFGLKEVEKIKGFINGKSYNSGTYGSHSGLSVGIIPTLISKNPISTVGLGDTFCAGTYLKQLELVKKPE